MTDSTVITSENHHLIKPGDRLRMSARGLRIPWSGPDEFYITVHIPGWGAKEGHYFVSDELWTDRDITRFFLADGWLIARDGQLPGTTMAQTLIDELREHGQMDEYHRDIWDRAANALAAAHSKVADGQRAMEMAERFPDFVMTLRRIADDSTLRTYGGDAEALREIASFLVHGPN